MLATGGELASGVATREYRNHFTRKVCPTLCDSQRQRDGLMSGLPESIPEAAAATKQYNRPIRKEQRLKPEHASPLPLHTVTRLETAWLAAG